MDPFATLGLARRYDLDPAEIERRYRELQRTLHPDRHVGAGASQRRMALGKAVEVNEAYRTLRDDQKRAESLLSLLGGGSRELHEQADPELLMEVMELREALGDAKAARDAKRVRALAERVSSEQRQARAALLEAFGALGTAPDAASLRPAARLVSRLKYYERFLEEVSAFEEAG